MLLKYIKCTLCLPEDQAQICQNTCTPTFLIPPLLRNPLDNVKSTIPSVWLFNGPVKPLRLAATKHNDKPEEKLHRRGQ